MRPTLRYNLPLMVPARLWWRRAGLLSWAAVLLLLSACAPTKPSLTPPVPLYQEGIASWYGPGFHGKKTTSGTVYDQYAMTAAHQTLPLGSSVVVTNLTNGKSVTVLINDRGPFVKERVIDLSYAAALAVDMIGPGTAPVRVDVVDTGGHRLTGIPDRLDYTRPRTSSYTVQVGAYHRVRVGTFVDYATAKDYGARLSREGFPAVIVEKWPPVP